MLALLAATLVAGCGKKGPPLAPLVRLPAQIADLSARRLGSDVVLQFTVPSANTDGSSPADLDRVEIYALSGQPSGTIDFLKQGTLVATVDVRRPAAPNDQDEKDVAGVGQGDVATASETVIGAASPAIAPPPASRVSAPLAGIDQRPTAAAFAARIEALPSRSYVAVGVSRTGRRGPVSPPSPALLVEASSPPPAVRVGYTAEAIALAWDPPRQSRRPVQEPPQADALPALALPIGPLVQTTGATMYNVYEIREPAASASRAVRLNEAPLESPTFTSARIDFGAERCYVVRSVDTFGTLRVESDPSTPACVTPVDTFAPSAPRELAAVASEGAVSLIWEPNAEKDLAGYLVLRGEAPGETLQSLTPAPIPETTYHDTTARRGVRYVYAVVAVDNATPPNRSAESNRAEETAR